MARCDPDTNGHAYSNADGDTFAYAISDTITYSVTDAVTDAYSVADCYSDTCSGYHSLGGREEAAGHQVC